MERVSHIFLSTRRIIKSFMHSMNPARRMAARFPFSIELVADFSHSA
jgi:hypothetical protein